MADRWSNPSGGLGIHRFRVWPAGSDSYDHAENSQNWDTLDGILGIPPSGSWPPTTGTNGGIYKLIKDLQDSELSLTDFSAAGALASRGVAATRGAGFWYLATDEAGGTLYRSNGSTWDKVASSVSVPGDSVQIVTVAEFLALTAVANMKVTLVDSKTAPTFRWNLTYNTSNSTNYKWEFIGGSKLVASDDQDYKQTAVLDSWLDCPGPTITAPVAGIYQIYGEGRIKGTADSGRLALVAGSTILQHWGRKDGEDQHTWTTKNAQLTATLARGTILKFQQNRGTASSGDYFSSTDRAIKLSPLNVGQT